MSGRLFSQDFLRQGIQETNAWKRLNEAVFRSFQADLSAIFAPFTAASQVNEAVTEADIIAKVSRALGWERSLPQQTASGKGRQDVPDILLFADAAGKQAALWRRAGMTAAIATASPSWSPSAGSGRWTAAIAPIRWTPPRRQTRSCAT